MDGPEDPAVSAVAGFTGADVYSLTSLVTALVTRPRRQPNRSGEELQPSSGQYLIVGGTDYNSSIFGRQSVLIGAPRPPGQPP